MTIQNDY